MNQEKDGNKEKEALFYDTYALYAIALGNENYKKYSGGYKILTTIMNLYELYYTLIRENHEELAESFFDKLNSSCIEINSEIIKKAAKFRAENTKKKLSYIDCLGYATARKSGIKFLTGDKGFENMPNVKFVKES